MNYFKELIFTILIVMFSGTMNSQNNCKVIEKDLIGEYEGDCKKGLAHGYGIAKGENMYEGEFRNGLPHGEGTMVYSTGEVYSGNWKKGIKHGNGELSFNYYGNDSIQKGIWKNGKYHGIKKKKRYKIETKQSVQRYTIRKLNGTSNRVTINIKNDGSTYKMPNNIFGSSGNIVKYQNSKAFENIVEFPFRCEMRYVMPGKLGGSRYDVVFIFQILEPGDWLVTIYH
ncbi:MAG: hypothetical protein QM478_13390 [Flavobacteriaceae bacterium]